HVDAVVGRFARLRRAVVALVGEPLDELVLEAAVDAGPREVPHLRREMLQLVRQHAPDFDLDARDVAYEKSDLAIARERHKRSLAEEREGPPVLRHAHDAHERLA